MKLKKEIESYVANRIQHVVFQEASSLVAQGICDYQDIDTAVAYGPGMRWAFAGPDMCYHLGGGKGGIRHMIDHFGWKREAKDKEGADRRDRQAPWWAMPRSRSWSAWRDDNLLTILKGLKPVPAKKG